MGVFVWFLANVITIIACIGSAIVWRERMRIATHGKQLPDLPRYRYLQYRRNYVWSATALWVNVFICCWGALMNIAAFTWEGDVPLFVWGGTSGFTVLWLAVTAGAFWDFHAVAEIAAAREEHDKETGC